MQPVKRPRRLRRTARVRALVREHRVALSQLVQPLFIVERGDAAGPISSMPGIERYTVDSAVGERACWTRWTSIASCCSAFPRPKMPAPASNYDPDGVVQQAARAIKEAFPHIIVIADFATANTPITDTAARSDARRHRQRRNCRPASANGADLRASRCRRHRAQRHDGRPRRRHSAGARRARICSTCDHGL